MTRVLISIFNQGSESELQIDLSTRIVSKALTIREDAVLQIQVQAEDTASSPRIELGDLPLQVIRTDSGNGALFSTVKARHFENYFGQCGLRIYLPNEDRWVAVQQFNVLAKKANAEQAEALLLELNEKGADILRFCFSKADFGADHANTLGPTDPGLILQQAERILSFFAKHRGYLTNHHRSRLVSEEKISEPNARPPIDDASISWLFQNLDQLSVSDRADFDLTIKGWKYNFAKIKYVALTENCNVYENQVLISLLFSVRERLSLHMSRANMKVLDVDEPLAGYVSFHSLLRKVLPVTGFWRDRCVHLLRECDSLIKFLRKSVPCDVLRDLRPTVTSFVRGNQVYRQAFTLADRWYSLGRPTWSGQEYLARMLSLPRLYEFYCLISIVETLKSLGYSISEKSFRSYIDDQSAWGDEVERPADAPFNHYAFSDGETELEVFYEPKIWAHRDTFEDGRVVDLSHAAGGFQAYRTPDFVIRVKADNCRPKYIFLDSKYSTPSSIREFHLPSLTEKYLLGTGEIDARLGMITQQSYLAVMALHPCRPADVVQGNSIVNPKHLVSKFGPVRRLVVPALGSVELGPGHKSELGSVLKRLIGICRAGASSGLRDGGREVREGELSES